MKKNRLKLLFVLTVLFLLVTGVNAQTSETNYVVTINEKATTRVVNYMVKSGFREDALNFFSKQINQTYILLIRTDSDGRVVDRETIYPRFVKILFGDAVTQGINDLKIVDGGEQAGEEMTLAGLAPNIPVQVYDAAGRLCLQSQTNEGKVVIGIGSLPKGLYVIKADKIVVKFMKK